MDTSTLINFLKIDRVDLLADQKAYAFFITDHVRGEVTDSYPAQVKCLDTAIQDRLLTEIPVSDLQEVLTFGTLMTEHRWGAGEAAAISAAGHRQLALAIDDRAAAKRAKILFPEVIIVNTQSLMVDAISTGLLTIAQADVIKDDWERSHRFRLRIRSFDDLLP